MEFSEAISGDSIPQSMVVKKRDIDPIVKVVFADYVIRPFKGFDLHDKWNNGVAPPSQNMYGRIAQETSGMYRFELYDENCEKEWNGWCPKKSCVIIEI